MDTLHDFRRVVCAGCGAVSDVPIYCGDRFCAVCSGPRRARLARKLTSIVKSVSSKHPFRWRFITLTIPTSNDPDQALTTLFHSFRKLRSRKFWKRYCDGGIFGSEITRSGDKWHVHVHLIVFARFIPQGELAKMWRTVSPGKIVDIRLLPETTAISYIVKYITKQSLPAEFRAEASRALSSRRMYSTFGICHGIKITVKEPVFCCKRCGQSDWQLLSMIGDGVTFQVDTVADTLQVSGCTPPRTQHAHTERLKLEVII